MQVGVRPQDQKFLRFLWKKGEKIICFQYRRLIFGARCSPTCCIFALRRTAEDNCQQYPSAAKAVLRSCYMDDLYHATDTVEEAISISKDLKKLLLLGGFNFTKWSSNSLETMKSIPKEDQNSNDTKESTILPPIPNFGEKDEQPSSSDTERVLGIQWSVSRDSFVLNSKTFKKVDLENPTQKKILKSVSSIYDPIGFIAPFTVRLRTIMQDVWRLGKQWGKLLLTSFDATLKSLMTEIRNISSIKIPRFLFEEKKTPKESTLHIFCDASLTAMCAVAYLKTEYTDSTGSINFIMGKAKVAPIRQQSIPKLELAAAVIGVRVAFFIKQQLDVTISKTTFWSDSATTLQFIYNSKETHKMYVANRVAEILETTSPSDWRHVPGVLNPADDGTRGWKLNEFKPDCRWFSGPLFLKHDPTNWPPTKVLNYPLEASMALSGANQPLIDPKRFSSFEKLKRVLAFVILIISNLKTTTKSFYLTIKTVNMSKIYLLRQSQELSFEEELDCLPKDQKVAAHSKIKNFLPFISDDGVIRANGRLANANQLAESLQTPVILSGKKNI